MRFSWLASLCIGVFFGLAWLVCVRGQIVDYVVPIPVEGSETPRGKEVLAEMNSTIIPWVDFHEVDIADVVRSLNAEIRKLAPGQARPIFLRLSPSLEADSAKPYIDRHVSITLEKCPLGDVLAYISNQTKLQYRIVPGREVELFSAALDKASQETVKRLGILKIDHIDFQHAEIENFIAVLNDKCKAADNGGISIRVILRMRPDDLPLAKIRRRRVTMQLHDAPMLDILQYATDQTDFDFVVEPGVVVIRPGRSDD
jgi:hypothetical protein